MRSSRHAVVENRLYLATGKAKQPSDERHVYLDLMGGWAPCDWRSRHIHPMSLVAVLHVREDVSKVLAAMPTHKVLVCHIDSSEPAKLMLARFLMASYLVLAESETVLGAFQRVRDFDPLAEEGRVDPYLHNPSSDELQSALDGLEALSHANRLGLIARLEERRDELEHYTNPLEGGCHWVVPEGLMILSSPTSIPNSLPYIDVGEKRYFASDFYVEPFKEMHVSTVVSLSDPHTTGYTSDAFEAANIRCASLEFEEGCVAEPQLAREFVRIMDTAQGAVALHCRTGSVQSAFFAALYIMGKYRFSAGAAVAWVRLARPGCLTAMHESFLRSVALGGPDSEPTAIPDSEACDLLCDSSAPCAAGTCTYWISREGSDAWERRKHRVRPQSSFDFCIDCKLEQGDHHPPPSNNNHSNQPDLPGGTCETAGSSCPKAAELAAAEPECRSTRCSSASSLRRSTDLAAHLRLWNYVTRVAVSRVASADAI